MFGLSQKEKDKKAVLNLFTSIFDEEDKKSDLNKKFIGTFLGSYNDIKKNSEEIIEKNNEEDLTKIIQETLDGLNNKLKNALNKGQEEQTQALGSTLGIFMATINFRLLPMMVKYNTNVNKKMNSSFIEMKNYLKKLNKKVKFEFIKKRITSIAKKYTGKLNKKQQEDISDIARIFTK